MGPHEYKKNEHDDSLSSSRLTEKKWFPMVFFSCWLVSLFSAFGIVHSTFETRKATQELEELRREATALKVVSGQYLLEQSSLGAYSRVEKIATKTLKMTLPGPDQTVLVAR